MQCEMCGKDSFLLMTKVEGTTLRLCSSCAKYGSILKPAQRPIHRELVKKPFIRKQEDEIEEMVMDDYALKVKNAREERNIKQEEVAKQINEKESLIHNIETGRMKPNIKLARKLEHFFGIKIIEEMEFQGSSSHDKKVNTDVLTLGDVIKIKKR